MFQRARIFAFAVAALLLVACTAPTADAPPTPTVSSPAAVAQPTVAPTPTTVALLPIEQLQAIDLEALVTQPDVLPDRAEVYQVSQRMPVWSKQLPPATTAVDIQLKRDGQRIGTVTALLYPTTAERDQAFITLRRSLLSSNIPDKVTVECDPPSSCSDEDKHPPLPTLASLETTADKQRAIVGERTYYDYILGVEDVASKGEIIWTRCHAVVQLRFVYDEPKRTTEHGSVATGRLNTMLKEYAERLDEALAAHVCANK